MLNPTFSYCPDSVVPEIPHIQDVFYDLGLSTKQECYDFCKANHMRYIANIVLLTAYFGEDIKSCTTTAAQRLVIAHAIMALSPKEAHNFEVMHEIICGPKYGELHDDDVKIVAKFIIMTSLDENEVKRRLRDELGYPHGEPRIICAPIRKSLGRGVVSTKNGTEVNLALLGHDDRTVLYI